MYCPNKGKKIEREIVQLEVTSIRSACDLYFRKRD